MNLRCEQVWAEISNYVDNDVEPSLRLRMDEHFKTCRHCRAVLEGTRNTVRILGDHRNFDVPASFSRRLYSRLERNLASEDAIGNDPARDMLLGITGDRVAVGSHLLYFWENDDEFARGVRFLEPGLGRGEHGIVFGHDEAIAKVLGVLRSSGHDPEQLISRREITVLRRHASAHVTLEDFRDIMDAALRAGATGIRWLGNLGVGRDPLPAGEDDVTDLEHHASALIRRYPCVIVCMYDVRTLPGRLILRGGLQEHELVVCCDAVRHNPYYDKGESAPVTHVN